MYIVIHKDNKIKNIISSTSNIAVFLEKLKNQIKLKETNPKAKNF